MADIGNLRPNIKKKLEPTREAGQSGLVIRQE